MYQVEILDSVEQWDALDGEWDALVAASDDDNPFRRFAWVRAWWKHYGNGRSLRMIAVRNGCQLVGIAPLFLEVEQAPFPVRSIRFLGGTDVCSEYLGLLILRGEETSVLPAILDVLLHDMSDEWDVIRWTDIPAAGEQLAVLHNTLESRGIFHTQTAGVNNWVVEFPDSWTAYVDSLSSSRRTKLRRIRREFDDRNDIKFEFAEDAAQFERCWDDLRILHNLHWSQAGQAGRFADPQFDAFHTELARDYFSR